MKFVQINMPTSSDSFLQKIFFCKYYINWPNFFTRLCLLPNLFNKMCFVIHAWAFDDVMTFEYLNRYFVLNIFVNSRHQVNFAVYFKLMMTNIKIFLSMLIFANSSHWTHADFGDIRQMARSDIFQNESLFNFKENIDVSPQLDMQNFKL